MFPTNKVATIGYNKQFLYDDQKITHDIELPQEGVGYNHGKFECIKGQWYYTDFPEKNGKGSYIKMEPLKEYELPIGSIVRFGSYLFEIQGRYKQALFSLRFTSPKLGISLGFDKDVFPIYNNNRICRVD